MEKDRAADLPQLALVREEIGTSRFYSYSFKHGWAIFTINDATHEFSIQSDWGNYSYRWSRAGMPEKSTGNKETLSAFLLTADDDYITNKLAMDQPREFKQQFAYEATVKELKKYLLGLRRSSHISAKEARDYLDDLDVWCVDHLRSVRSEVDLESAVRDLPDELSKLFDHSVYEHFVYQPSSRFLFLKHRLLPFFKEQLRTHI